MANLPPALSGFWVTFSTMFKHTVTEQYPEQAEEFPPNPASTGVINSTGTQTVSKSVLVVSSALGRVQRMRSTYRAATTPPKVGFRRGSATGGFIRSTTCAVSSAGCASKRVPRGR